MPPLILAAGAVALTSCAKSLVTTTIRPDGSWSRIVKLTADRNDKSGKTSGPSLQQAFVLPKGDPWRTRWERTQYEVSYVAERSLTSNQALHGDVIVRGDNGRPSLDNDATVRQVSPGTWEYREVLHWRGTKDHLNVTDPQVLRSIKQAMPAGLATDENARFIGTSIAPSIWEAMFGPPEPLAAQFAAHPDLAEQLLTQHLGPVLDATLQERFGDRLTGAQRWDVTHKILVSVADLIDDKDDKANSSSVADALPVALTFVTQVPGQIVSTNGDVNLVTHEVFWGLYPEAAEFGDVTLTATYKVGPEGTSPR